MLRGRDLLPAGADGAQRALRVVSVQQGRHRELLVRDAVQGDVPAVGPRRLQHDPSRRRHQRANRDPRRAHLLLRRVPVPAGPRHQPAHKDSAVSVSETLHCEP